MKLLDKMKVVAWNIGFIEKSIDEVLSDEDNPIIWMQHKYNDRFFADPFILAVNENTIIILAEEYRFWEGKGKIVKLTVDKTSKRLIKRQLLIETKYHMSYPFLYNDSILAEQSASNKWIQYSLDGVEKNVLADIGFVDGTVFNDGKQEWLFATKVTNGKQEANRKLYRYKMKNGKPILETELIIKNDYDASRPGGKFFLVGSQWYRVAQNSRKDIYGESVSICRVICCNNESYYEEIVKTLSSHLGKRYSEGMHTLNVENEFIVVDGFEMQNHPFQKVFFKVRSFFRNDI